MSASSLESKDLRPEGGDVNALLKKNVNPIAVEAQQHEKRAAQHAAALVKQHQEIKHEVKKKSKNPLKLFSRSHSHHEIKSGSKPFATKNNNATHAGVHIKRASTGIQGKSSNPFVKNSSSASLATASSTSPFAVLGAGTDIASPRNAPSRRSSSQQAPAMHYNPYGMNSNNPSVYSLNTNSHLGDLGSCNPEKEKLLPLPVQNPNDYLPDDEKQDFVLLNDEFNIPEKGSNKEKQLGDGASSHVVVVIGKKDRKQYAFKKFCLIDEDETPDEFYKRASKEFLIAKALGDNKHIVHAFYMLKVQTTLSMSRGWGFVLELCKGGDLFNLISKTGWKSSPTNEKYCLFRQITYALKWMHSKGFAHRDLKPENCLIDETGCVKLTDFGVAIYGREDENDVTSPIKLNRAYVGSPPYIPPEVMNLKGNLHNTKIPSCDSFKQDLWALGMVLFCIVYQGIPFQSAESTDSQYRDYLVSYSTYLSSNPSFKFGDKNHGPGVESKFAKEFHSSGAARVAWRLCDPDVETRYTLENVFKDPWFQSLETCIAEDDDEEFVPNSSRVGSFDSNTMSVSSRSMLDLAAPSPSPKIQPLDSSSVIPSSDSQPNTAALPPLEEVDTENAVSPVANGLDSLSIEGSNDVFYDANAAAQQHQQTHQQQTLPKSPNNPVSSSAINRSSSFTSINSTRSTNSSTRRHPRIKRHHHLDVSNVQTHNSMRLTKH